MDCRLPRPARHRAPLGVAVTAAAIVSALALTSSAPALAAVTAFGAPASLAIAGGTLGDADGIAVAGSTTYVLDGTAKKVIALDASGAVTAVADLSSLTTSPSDIAVNGTTMYVADSSKNQIASFTMPVSGTTTPALTVVVGNTSGAPGVPVPGTVSTSGAGGAGLRGPRGIDVDGSGNLYIADTGNNQVLKVTGTTLSIIAGNGSSSGGTTPPTQPGNVSLSTPEDVAVDASGVVYVAESGNSGRIDKIDSTGTTLSVLGSVAGATSLDVSSGTVAVTSGTGVVALDAASGGSATSIATGMMSADAVTFGADGTVWVADANGSSSKVWKIAPAASAGAPVITSPSTLTAPSGTALSRTLTATGSPTGWQLLSATPAASGLGFSNATTGTLTWPAPTAGSYTVVVRASGSSGAYYDKTITLNVGAVPAAPAAAPKATPGQGSATVTWTAPTASSVAGEAVTGYTITPYVGTTAGTPVTAAAGATSTVVSGLTSGTAYTFTVAATNAFGAGAASAASTAVTPFGGFVQPAAGLTRYEGGTRVQTAVSVSQKLFPGTGSSRAVVIASSTNYADSLAGARLASAVGGPLLLTDPLALNTEVASEVARVLAVPAAAAAGSTPAASAGSAPSQTAVGTVYLLGGTSAVSAAVETAVKAVNAKYTVTRISGTDRFDTAVKIAAQTAADDGGASAPIYVASGTNYPDGLAVAALAARTGGVVLLTDGSKMPDATLKYLQTYDPNSELLVAVGGPAAKATSGHGADRAVIGTDRYDTARRVAELFTAPTGSAPVRSVGLATGDNWPDALAGAAAMGNLDGPLLLTPSGALSPSTSSALTALAKKGRPTSALVFGGSSVVSTGTANDFTSGATR
ncbi:cell wall-binding repeat-containing protein [Quadrisphaera setariae]|uniref:Fibronectin type-III domain-containing protein n=1 Tax=Quadrisphaera setariae TaxID=2593304 RepID=A0A5C8ZLM0_9ACTN|nr:cell wall-binding repeat-containing protein [Quadrisphaera setariae]TXR58039.1 hypothetical protein FMM08_02150 [Quadrisphaera setariae]